MSKGKTPWWQNKTLNSHLETNIKILNDILGVGKSFDMICRRTKFWGKACAFYFVDGFAKDMIMNRIMNRLADLKGEDLKSQVISRLLDTEIAYIEVDQTDKLGEIVNAVLSGPTVLLIDGETTAIIIDARTYPVRGPEEPDTERVVRGARDGFVETIIFNTALTRRHVRDPGLRMEYLQVGRRSKTDICLAYVEDLADPRVVEELRTSIKKIDTDSLHMAEKTLEEHLFKRYWNPYPMVRFTERPDVAAVHLMEGHVLIYVDTSPSVMITPSTFFHHVQHAEEYRQKPVVGAFMRLVRLLAMGFSLFLLPVFYLMTIHAESLPPLLQFIAIENNARLPLFLQFVIAEVWIEILRMASIHTPSPLATAMGLIAGILLGEIAINVGWFASETVLYVALAVIGTFATPSYEMGVANKIVRLGLLAVTAMFGIAGFVIGCVALVIWLARIKVLITPYLWPLIPFDGRALIDVLIRSPMPNKTKRPSAISRQDPDRQPEN
ncbi:spore germination protein [Thermoactinomyces mirandus]|uniref:Spore germination protein n=1 Tax=Thermoactinomyces mirandus TaxID=2756294 RepID=A0A7W2ARK8_9BACL|nr:spore germination protein [Thermoactinomyces mirandus]MBA4601685.1 spore germination protein [Thermoactinomyces mirandus]